MEVLFYLLLLVNAVSSVTVSVIAPFFPPLAEDLGLTSQIVGIILASNPIGSFLASIIIAKCINTRNRLLVLITGLILQAVGLSVFIALNYIDDDEFFLALAIVGRLLQGIGVSAQAVPTYGLIPVLYPQQVEKRISYIELSTGAGYILGPLCGSVLYEFGGYEAPFIFFSALILCCVPFIYKYLKRGLREYQRLVALVEPIRIVSPQDPSTVVTENATILNDIDTTSPISFKRVVGNISISLTFLVTMLSTFSYMYFEPIQATFLIEYYGLDEKYIGYLMSVITVTYILGCILIGQLRLSKKQLLMGGVLLSAITFFFQGPDERLTKFDHLLWVVIVAQAVLGLACAMIFIPALPLLNEILLEMFPKREEDVGNLAAALFNIAISCGEFAGPLLGGFVTGQYGYINGCTYTGGALLTLGLTYAFVFCEKPMKSKTKSFEKSPISKARSFKSPIFLHKEEYGSNATMEDLRLDSID